MTGNDSAPQIEWYWLRHSSIQPNKNRITLPEAVFFHKILDREKDAHWSLDLLNEWVMVSRYEPVTPLPGRTPHPESLHEDKDLHHLTSTIVQNDPQFVTVPSELMEDFGGTHRGEILANNSDFWFETGETCHFAASNVMIVSRVMYMLKDEVGRDFVNERIDADMEDFFVDMGEFVADGGRLMTDGGEEPVGELDTGEQDQIIPEAVVGPQEVLNLTTGEALSFEEAEERIEDQREEIEQWLEQQREEAAENNEK